jgi:aspartate dehydrogenase
MNTDVIVDHCQPLYSHREAQDFDPEMVVECAGQEAVRTLVPLMLSDGVPVLIASVGALADPLIHMALRSAAQGQARMLLPPGAIGGLDYLDAVAGEADLQVDYMSTKPVTAWRDELRRQGIDPDVLDRPYVLFAGSATQAARLYPQNLNVAATLALHGAGMDATRVTVVADPSIDVNTHEVRIRSAAGVATFRFENKPSIDNPKTSALAALSLASEVARFFRDGPLRNERD